MEQEQNRRKKQEYVVEDTIKESLAALQRKFRQYVVNEPDVSSLPPKMGDVLDFEGVHPLLREDDSMAMNFYTLMQGELLDYFWMRGRTVEKDYDKYSSNLRDKLIGLLDFWDKRKSVRKGDLAPEFFLEKLANLYSFLVEQQKRGEGELIQRVAKVYLDNDLTPDLRKETIRQLHPKRKAYLGID